jgi:hypothetical protein
MIELVLNAVWLVVVVSAFALIPRRSTRAMLGVACVLVLLFPVISVSDDLALDGNSLEQAMAIVVAILVLVTGLIAISRVESQRLRPSLILIATPSDPRSPPRA